MYIINNFSSVNVCLDGIELWIVQESNHKSARHVFVFLFFFFLLLKSFLSYMIYIINETNTYQMPAIFYIQSISFRFHALMFSKCQSSKQNELILTCTKSGHCFYYYFLFVVLLHKFSLLNTYGLKENYFNNGTV